MTTCKECKFSCEITLPFPGFVVRREGNTTEYSQRAYKCRRYPEPVIVQEDYWCGEFAVERDMFWHRSDEERLIIGKVLKGEATDEEWKWLANRGIIIGNKSCGGSLKD